MNARATLLAVALLALLAGCRAGPPAAHTTAVTPPGIIPGADVTYPDGRPIDDLRYAGLYVTPMGEVRRFDDVGRLVATLETEAAAGAWVYDHETIEQVPAEAAVFVASSSLVTPRGSGLIAFGSEERARAAAMAASGQVLAWADVPAYLQAVPSAPPMPQSTGPELGGLLEADPK